MAAAANHCNRVTLSGEIIALEPLRHTPAGLPLSQFKLLHRSVQVEANIERQTECEVDAVALGEISDAVCRLQAGDRVTLQGFLATRRRAGTQARTPFSPRLVLHVTQITSFSN